MKKEEIIRRYRQAAYKKKLQQTRDWRAQHREEVIAKTMEWQARNPEQTEINRCEQAHKGRKRYAKMLKWHRTGIPAKRNRIRALHYKQYRPYKQLIAPGSQIHHEWIPKAAKYRGVALVEKDQHMHRFVDVIKILGGKITLLTEKEIAEQVVE